MKRIITILIACIVFASLFLVGYLGAKPYVFDPITYVNDIKIYYVEDGLQKYDVTFFEDTHGDYYFVNINYRENLTVEINYNVFPISSTDSSIEFISSSLNVATVNEEGCVSFLRSGLAEITLRANDAQKFKIDLKILAQ